LSASKRVWKNEYFKTAVAIILIVAIVLTLLFGLQFVLHTPDPALTVESGSMSIPYDGADNFWDSIAHPFDRTLSIGDIIIVEGVNPKDLNTNYPNSDIIVFHSPSDYNILIVHRIIGTVVYNGTTYFLTKGDGNGNPWPQKPISGEDPWDGGSPPGVPSSYIVGKVVMRIPWLGWVTLFMKDNSWGLPLIIALIMLLVVIEFIVPILREKKPEQPNPMQPQSQMSL
jgi:signal peptidase I